MGGGARAPAPRLRALAASVGADRDDLPDPEVLGVAQDHRLVRPGWLFVARTGAARDGHRYARLAVEAGAVAVAGERDGVTTLPWGRTPYLRVADAREAVAVLAAEARGRPAERLRLAGVTGTDGKTTTSTLLHRLLGGLPGGAPAGLLSTAAVRLGERELGTVGRFTTPEAPQIHDLLARFVDGGAEAAVLESSSHAFAQGRLHGIRFEVGVMTNVSPEHLDFHGSFEAYRDAKLELARRSGVLVANRDDPSFEAFAAAAAGRVVAYGLGADADWRATDVRAEPGRLRFRVRGPDGALDAALPMVGRFNVANALAALASAHAMGVPAAEGVARLEDFPGVPGRMQVVRAEPFAVVVDFAHTAPALEKAIQELRPGVRGRLIVVIGAAGERDPRKRAPLGFVAARDADLAVFTEEDHRSEDLDAILAEMMRGAREAGAREGDGARLVPDRRDAIRAAVAEARPGDLVLLAGKGHEATLERGDGAIPWDEAAEARRALGLPDEAPARRGAAPGARSARPGAEGGSV